MPLATLDRSPPPFFRQGPSSLTRLVVLSALAVFLMAADSRWQITQPVRSGLATMLAPVQRALAYPVQAWQESGAYLEGLHAARLAEARAKAQLAAQAERAARARSLEAENARLRSLLDLRPLLVVRSQSAEVLYEAPDPYSRKLLLDRGAAQGIQAGSPVVNEQGVLGQVTRVYPLSSEVTLLVDKDAAISVLNLRTQARGAAFGAPGGGQVAQLELRFMPGNADVQVGDELVTSGVDGVYPAGLPVARIAAVDRRADTAFARIVLAPSAPPDGVRHVLVLEPLSVQLPPWPQPEATSAPKPGKAVLP